MKGLTARLVLSAPVLLLLTGCTLNYGLQKVRAALFSTFVTDRQQIEDAPERLQFARDSASLLRDFPVPAFAALPWTPPSTAPPLRGSLKEAVFLVRGGLVDNVRRCLYHRPLIETVERTLTRSQGCCTDNVETLIVVLAKRGYTARKIGIDGHVFAEVFDYRQRRWFFIDPTTNYIAHQNGQYLSALEVRAALQSDTHFAPTFFGTAGHTWSTLSASDFKFYRQDAWNTISVTQGNNVIDVGNFRIAWGAIPFPLVEVAGFLFGPHPRYTVFLDDAAVEGHELLLAQRISAAIGVMFAFVLVLILLRRRRRARSLA